MSSKPNKKVFPVGDIRINFTAYAAGQDLHIISIKNMKVKDFKNLWPELWRKLE